MVTEQQLRNVLRDAHSSGFGPHDLVRIANEERIAKHREARRATAARRRPNVTPAKWAQIKADIIDGGGHNDTNAALRDIWLAIKADSEPDFWDAVLDLVDAKNNEQPHVRREFGI